VRAERRPAMQMGWLKPSLSMHTGWRPVVSRSITPRQVSRLCPGRVPKAMRHMTAAAYSGHSVRAA
jgi:hypothetical protein